MWGVGGGVGGYAAKIMRVSPAPVAMTIVCVLSAEVLVWTTNGRLDRSTLTACIA